MDNELEILRRDLEKTNSRLNALLDRIAIQDLLNTYARAIDRGDIHVLKTVFHEGSRDEHGIFSGSGDEFAEFITPYIVENYRMMQHQHTTMSIDIRDDQASVETYFLCIQAKPNGDLEFSAGRTADRMEKRNGRWGIVYRQVIMDWTLFLPEAQVTSVDDKFLKGRYCDLDPAYGVLPELRESALAYAKINGNRSEAIS